MKIIFVLLATNHILSKRILYTKVGNSELSLEQVDDPLLLGSVLLYLFRSTGSTYRVKEVNECPQRSNCVNIGQLV